MLTTERGPARPGAPPPPARDWNRVGWGVARAVALTVLWNLAIPVLPASFLIAPHVWRGVCPLATLDQWAGKWAGRRRLGGRLLTTANVLGILLLAALVPARRFLLNENGPALAATIGAVAAAAVVLGARFDRRAGFCNAVCPVLPVERLYGQRPLLRVDNRRCDRCSRCIPKGCLDVDPVHSFARATGRADRGHRWLTTPYGAFAAALPGFVVGYFTTGNVPRTAAADVYLWVALCSAGSYLAATCVILALGLSRPAALALLAAAAAALYYWWAAPLIAGTLGLPAAGAVAGRAAAAGLVAVWLARAWPRRRAGREPLPLL